MKKKNIELDNDYYHEYLYHKCLYYKHCTQVLQDTDFDFFEKEYAEYMGIDLTEDTDHLALGMVDWNGNASSTARKIERMNKQQVIQEADKLVAKRKARK